MANSRDDFLEDLNRIELDLKTVPADRKDNVTRQLLTHISNLKNDYENTITERKQATDSWDVTEGEQQFRIIRQHLNDIKNKLEAVVNKKKAPTKLLEDLQHTLDDLNDAIEDYKKLRGNETQISKVNYVRDLSEYAYYTTYAFQLLIAVWAGLLVTIPPLLTIAGIIFPPLAYTMYSVRSLLAFFTKVWRLTVPDRLKDMNHLAGPHQQKILASQLQKGIFIRALSDIIVAGICVVLVLAAVGVIVNPIGFGLVALSSFVGFFGDMAVPAWHAREHLKTTEKNLKDTQDAIVKLKNEIAVAQRPDEIKSNKIRLDQLKQDERRLKVEVTAAKKDYQSKRREAFYGIASVIGMTLIALSGPFGIVPLVLGIAAVAVVATRGVAKVAQKKYFSDENKKTAHQQKSISEETVVVATVTKRKSHSLPSQQHSLYPQQNTVSLTSRATSSSVQGRYVGTIRQRGDSSNNNMFQHVNRPHRNSSHGSSHKIVRRTARR